MKLSELISQVGDENIKVQNLFESMTAAKLLRSGATEIAFGTTEVSTTEIMLDTSDKIGLVIWIPKNKLAVK